MIVIVIVLAAILLIEAVQEFVCWWGDTWIGVVFLVFALILVAIGVAGLK